MSYLRYLCLFGSSLPQLFVGELMSYLRYLCLFGSSSLLQTTEVKTNQTNTNNVNKTWALLQTTEVKTNQTNTNNVVRFVFTSVVCRRAHVLFTLFVFVWFVFTSVVCRRAHVLFTLFVFVWYNVNKTWALLQTTGGKDEPNKHK
jgi:hypothetical protein